MYIQIVMYVFEFIYEHQTRSKKGRTSVGAQWDLAELCPHLHEPLYPRDHTQWGIPPTLGEVATLLLLVIAHHRDREREEWLRNQGQA